MRAMSCPLTMARDLGVMNPFGEWGMAAGIDAHCWRLPGSAMGQGANLAETESWLVYPFLLLNSIPRSSGLRQPSAWA